MAGGAPYARAQTCTPAECVISPGVASISRDGAPLTGAGGAAVTITSTGTTGNLALSGTTLGGSGANGEDGDWHPIGSNDPATAGQTGGNGGDVTITNSGAVAPSVNSVPGIYAAVVGAAGGNGGNGTVTVPGARGGNGGGGGDIFISNTAGGTISITNTTADGPFGVAGITAYASGGAGGRGGGNGSEANAGPSGSGGGGGWITISNNASITASGISNSGIIAVSDGGAGGDGVSFQDDTFVTSAPVGIGGNGGGYADIGNNGVVQGSAVNLSNAAVAINNSGSIFVSSAGAYSTNNIFSGVWASSSGGRGGNVGYSTYTGGAGGNGGTVYVSHSGTIRVEGRYGSVPHVGYVAAGVGAVAAGGVGGQGGVHYDVGGVYGGVGGQGGSGGIASIVITSGSSILTTAKQVPAVYAGASGGNGGLAGFGDGYSSGGGDGGTGGTATITAAGTFQTWGDNAPAVAGVAVGGNGGVPAFSPYTIAGGKGGKGGTVIIDASFVTAAGQYTTTGASSAGLLANASGGIGAAGKNGGAGGAGGSATVAVGGQIVVSGTNSSGIVVLAAGGMGGTGGVDPSGNTGTGGAGGIGGTASLTSTAQVIASGTGAMGVYVSTRGGSTGYGSLYHWPVNAGSGGYAYVKSAGSISVTGDGSGAGLRVNTGGGNAFYQVGKITPDHVMYYQTLSSTTGAGGGAGNAYVVVSGSITTGGTGSPPWWNPGQSVAPAILIQSSGGNGGYGGQYGPGPLGSGGAAGTVTLKVTNGPNGAPQFFTAGGNSPGIDLQAIGGTGGIGHAETGGSTDDAGSGGLGGAGGGITLHIYSADVGIVTTGAQSAGISANASGGNGGSGINGNDGGTAGTIEIKTSATIATLGDSSAGILAVSNSGNGGAGVDAAGAGGSWTLSSYAVSVINQGTISTLGTSAPGIEVISLGGNGGSVGSGGDGGKSGNVQVLNAGIIVTSGDGSHGITNMSVGGGGGTYNAYDPQSKTLKLFVQGGQGASGADAGLSNLVNSGSITTSGEAAYGIFVASMGGGGGAGGSVSNLGLGAFGVPSIDIAVGGKGGSGGKGGTVTVTNNAGGDITTHGWDSPGIGVLSLGGDGGIGGQASSSTFAFGFLTDVPSFTFSATIAGAGGTGGDGGTVTVYNVGNITTTGALAPGIVAQSIGGGGGNGGNALAQSLAFGISPNSTISITAGGAGGSGGNGGTVTVNNTNSADPTFTGSAEISTSGFASDAIAAYSIGGGGGLGGAGVSAVDAAMPFQTVLGFLPLAFSQSFSQTITLGGDGGQGGDGESVTVTNNYKLVTTGLDARGIVAMSLGGGGGAAAAGKATASQEVAFSATVGGTGGVGGNGGIVTVTNTADGIVETSADGAHGIFAASIGGGGGTGGTATADTQSSQGDQTWEAITKATIATIAHYAQTGQKLLEFSPTVQITFTVGGQGGAGGNGAAVNVTNSGSITTGASGGTGGDLAIGIVAQSVGGGGGVGATATVSGSRLLNSNMYVGGQGGAYGTGGNVTVTSTGSITTAGDSAFGVLAQSVGGGGGIGGLATAVGTATFLPHITIGGGSGATASAATSTGGTVNVTVSAVSTSGVEAHGVVAQSVSGGGGVFFINPSDETDLGSLSYQQEIADIVVAAVGQAAVDAAVAEFNAAMAASSGTITLDIGGQPAGVDVNGGGGAGGAVNVTNSGTIATSGADAFGILAQSIGGGGGFFTDGTGVPLSSLSIAGTLGNLEGESLPQSGGTVTVTLADGSAVTTTGAGATAIVAQSIGGGGGYTGAIDSADMTYQTFLSAPQNDMVVNNNSAGGDVVIQTVGSASISTTGANAHGIVAQSLSGGGGLVGNANGLVIPQAAGGASRNLTFQSDGFSPGSVTITYTGTLSTTGADSIAIFAQSGVQTTSGAMDRSYATSPSGDVTVTIGADSTITGGSGQGMAIFIDGGGTNTITIGDGARVTAASNVAISVPWGATSVSNSGFLLGDLYLPVSAGDAASSLVFVNAESGYYQSTGTPPTPASPGNGTIQLGATGTMSNAGTFNIGGTNTIAAATVTGTQAVSFNDGAFAQTTAGTLQVDVQGAGAGPGAAPTSDQLIISSAGDIGGTVTVNVMNAINPTDQFTIITQTQGLTPLGTAAANLTYAPINSGGAELTWTPSFTANTLTIAPVADFTPSGTPLNANQTAYAQHLQATWDAGGAAALGPIYAGLVNVPGAAAYQRALGTAAPAIIGAGAVAAIGSSRTALSSVLSCPEFEPTGTLLQQGECSWARVDAGFTSFTPADYTGFDLKQTAYRMGLQKEIAPGWFAGASAAYGLDAFTNEFGYSSSSGQNVGLSASLKRELGPWLLSGAVHLDYGWYDATRNTIIGHSAYISSSSYEAYTVAGRLKAEYELPFSAWYLKPYGQLDLIYTSVPGFSEGGHLSPVDLVVAQEDNFAVALGPHLEVGARFDLPDGSVLRPFGTIGATWFSSNSWDVTARLANAPAGVGGFDTVVTLPDLLADVDVGLQWSSTQGVDLRFSYEGVFGTDYVSHAGSLRFSLRF
ncbi:hypothetical protein ACI7BZ_11625 [Xanthobacter sp. AM11]|uniref:hypothetical protein n=1 Tax=Xanthobacter sp. AM11 TaxID=3380643 RepID=UPI0039BFE581